jgi:hypothetical protein
LTLFTPSTNKAVLVHTIPDVWKDSTEGYMEVRGQLDVPGWLGSTGGLESLEKEKSLARVGNRTLDRPDRSLVSILTMLSMLLHVKGKDRHY